MFQVGKLNLLLNYIFYITILTIGNVVISLVSIVVLPILHDFTAGRSPCDRVWELLEDPESSRCLAKGGDGG